MICVAGMPRSGTSMVAQMLHRSGVDLGPAGQLMPASVNNRDGFWENLRFVRLNERLLAASGGTWFAPPAALKPSRAITDEARALMADFEGKEPWAWKDPRNALTLPFWKSLLPSMKVLVCIRYPEETASSLVASTLVPRSVYWTVTRAGSPIRLQSPPEGAAGRIYGLLRSAASTAYRRRLVRELGLELWRISNTRILAETSPEERIVVSYDAILSNPRAELERILMGAGLRIDAEALDDATRIVKPRLRHQQQTGAELEPDLAALYARLLEESRLIR